MGESRGMGGGKKKASGFLKPSRYRLQQQHVTQKARPVHDADCRSCWNHPTTFYEGLFGRYKCWERAIAMSLIQMGLSANQIAAELKPSVCQLNPPLFSHWKSKYFGLASRSGALPIFQNPQYQIPRLSHIFDFLSADMELSPTVLSPTDSSKHSRRWSPAACYPPPVPRTRVSVLLLIVRPPAAESPMSECPGLVLGVGCPGCYTPTRTLRRGQPISEV